LREGDALGAALAGLGFLLECQVPQTLNYVVAAYLIVTAMVGLGFHSILMKSRGPDMVVTGAARWDIDRTAALSMAQVPGGRR
jgi:DUF3096 family protein